MKRILKPKPRRAVRMVRSMDEWSDLIRGFDACASIEDREKFLAYNNASRSSIFRWKRILIGSQNEAVHSDIPRVGQAIETLCCRESERDALVEAIALFGAWLRWSSNRLNCKAATAVLLARYFSVKRGEALSSLSKAEITMLSTYASLNDIALAIGNLSQNSVDFWEFADFENGYSELEFITDTIGVMISYARARVSRKTSLGSMYNLVEQSFFGREYVGSKTKFNQVWGDHGAAAPFNFVERYDIYFRWRFAPFEENYADYVDEIMGDADARQAYFAKSLWVIDILRTSLGRNALEAVTFPPFPTWLTPLPIENFSIGETAIKIKKFLA